MKTLEQLLKLAEELKDYAAAAEEFPHKLCHVEADGTPSREAKSVTTQLRETIQNALGEYQDATDRAPDDLVASLNQQTQRVAAQVCKLWETYRGEARYNNDVADNYEEDAPISEAEEYQREAEELIYRLQTDESTMDSESPQESVTIVLPPKIMKPLQQQCSKDGRSLAQAAKAAILWFIEHTRRQEAESRLQEVESGGGFVYPEPLSEFIVWP